MCRADGMWQQRHGNYGGYVGSNLDGYDGGKQPGIDHLHPSIGNPS